METRDTGSYCEYPSTYTITSQAPVFAVPELVTGDFIGPGPTGGSIAAGYTYSKAVGVTGGISGTFEL
jgi:hypothetical protein